MEELGKEMDQVAAARALALAQQEQRRLAMEVDKISEMTQANAAARAASHRKVGLSHSCAHAWFVHLTRLHVFSILKQTCTCMLYTEIGA